MRLLSGLVAALGLAWLTAAHATDRVNAAIEAADPIAIEALLASPGGLRAPQQALLQGTLAAMRFDDRGAIEALSRGLMAGPESAAQRRQMLSLLGGVHLRAHNYAAAAEALDAALAADPTRSEADSLSLKQTRDVAHVLRQEAPQSHEPIREGAVAIVRDAANLARSIGRINGVDQEMILDTGAGFSTLSRSTAARLKLRLLPGAITVGSVTVKALPAQLGIAHDVEIAGNRFRNAVFLVTADEALSFANGAYKIDAILGFPVLARLGRIEFASSAAGEAFRVTPSQARPAGARDLYLDTMRPTAIVEMAGVGRVRMLIDSGARRSAFNGAFAAAYPNAMHGAASEKTTIGGAGGMQTLDVRVLRNVTIVADGERRSVDSVRVSSEQRPEHGVLGQDVLRAGGGFALDFVAMDLVFLPPR